jgi:hypothetical protein
LWPSGTSLGAVRCGFRYLGFRLNYMSESTTYQRRQPWDPRPGESDRAYHAFECYLFMPPEERTLEEAYRLHTDNPNAANPSDACKGWARRYDWKGRASAYDDHVRRLRREAQERGMAEEAERQGREVERLRSDMLELARRHYQKAMEIFEQPLDIANYNMGHAVQMTKLVLEIYKLARDEAREARPAEDESGWSEIDDEFLDEFIKGLEEEADCSADPSDDDGSLEESSEEPRPDHN